jgi:3(or 17)beta-hydroxysteroid dehydrogenase
MTLADWRRVFAVNLDSIFLGTKHAIRAMTPRGGSIVNVSSASGICAVAVIAVPAAAQVDRQRAEAYFQEALTSCQRPGDYPGCS